MFNTLGVALDLATIYENCQTALNGVLHDFLDAQNAMTPKELKRFNLRATEIANQSFTDTVQKLRYAVEQIEREERLRAYTDAQMKHPHIVLTDSDITETEKMIRQLFINSVLSGLRLAKSLMAQHNMLVSSGVNPENARVRIRERNRGKILDIYSPRKNGAKVKAGWAVYLMLAQAMNFVRHTSYMKQAASIGFTHFEIVQPGHARDGIKFTVETYPEKELHPQCQASIRIVLEV
ncbi:hypothetical protein ACK2J6_001155 [Vibrio fluvialis]